MTVTPAADRCRHCMPKRVMLANDQNASLVPIVAIEVPINDAHTIEARMLYHLLKTIHLIGVVLLVGNVIVTLVWKLRADRTGEPSVIAFAQRLVTLTDWWFTLGGVILILVGGFGAAWHAGLDPFGVPWLLWGQVLFGISGLLWASILIPAQIRQAGQARAFATTGVIPAAYWRDARRWTWWGILAILPLLVAIWIMIAKPTAASPSEMIREPDLGQPQSNRARLTCGQRSPRRPPAVVRNEMNSVSRTRLPRPTRIQDP